MVEFDGRDMSQAKFAKRLDSLGGFFRKTFDLNHPAIIRKQISHSKEHTMFMTLDIDFRDYRRAGDMQEIIKCDRFHRNDAVDGSFVSIFVDAGAASVVISRDIEIGAACAVAHRFFNDFDCLQHPVYQQVSAQLNGIERVCFEGNHTVEERRLSHLHRIERSMGANVQKKRWLVSLACDGRESLKEVDLFEFPGAIDEKSFIDGVALIYQEDQAIAVFHCESGASPTRVAAKHAGSKPVETADFFKAFGNGPHQEGRMVRASA